MSVEVYKVGLCKNPIEFFGIFEQTILIFILVQIGSLNYNLNLYCPIALEIFLALSSPYQTLKSRSLDPLGYF